MRDDGSSDSTSGEGTSGEGTSSDAVARFERALGTLLLLGGIAGAVAVALWLAWLLG